jgi:uncharacterized phiE125 gp8 family phage protein
VSLVRLSGPTATAVSLAEAKAWLRIDDGDHDATVMALVRSAQDWLENWLGRAFISQQWQYTIDRFPCLPEGVLVLPREPLISVDLVQYLDLDGDTQLLPPTAYRVLGVGDLGRIAVGYGQVWPAVHQGPAAVIVTFTCGHGADHNAVPEELRLALQMMTVAWYDQSDGLAPERAGELPVGVTKLLEPYRSWAF